MQNGIDRRAHYGLELAAGQSRRLVEAVTMVMSKELKELVEVGPMSRPKSERGVSLVETMVAVFIAMIALTSMGAVILPPRCRTRTRVMKPHA